MYAVGQVLFVALAKKNQIYPMQIVEVIKKTTLAGEEIQYVLQAGADKNSRVMFDKIEGEVFDSVEKVRETITQRAISQVSKMVDEAAFKAQEWYGTPRVPSTIVDLPALSTRGTQSSSKVETLHHQQNKINDDDDSEVMEVMLPDGTLSKVSLSKVKLPEMG